MHPNRNTPRAFLFPSSFGTAFSVGNHLKRYLKPPAEKAGVRRFWEAQVLPSGGQNGTWQEPGAVRSD